MILAQSSHGGRNCLYPDPNGNQLTLRDYGEPLGMRMSLECATRSQGMGGSVAFPGNHSFADEFRSKLNTQRGNRKGQSRGD